MEGAPQSSGSSVTINLAKSITNFLYTFVLLNMVTEYIADMHHGSHLPPEVST